MNKTGFFAQIREKAPLLLTLAKREIRQQYVGSSLGILWQLITPIVLITVFWVVFSVGFRVKPASGVPFAVWLTAGMCAWFAFAEIVSGSTHCITGNAHLVKKVVFPLQGLPLVKVLTGLSNHLMFLLILMVLIFLNDLPLTVYYLQGLYYFFCLVVLGLGIGWIVAAFNVFTRDTARLVGVLLQVGMWATPILWDIKILPEPYRSIFAANPVHYIVQGYRDSFLYATPVSSRVDETIYFWIIAGGLFFLGAYLFRKLQPQFADLV
jgi:lipopolysaccharide transport system permease protein/teichoic acid transport system permease protein